MKKTEPRIMFPRFRTEHADYVKAQKHWNAVFDSVVHGPSKIEWNEWFPDKPPYDGNGIFSRVSRRLRKGILINQVMPVDDSLIFRAWMNTFGMKGYDDEIEYLTISCIPTEESLKEAGSLIRAYLVDQLPRHKMEALCAKMTRESEAIDA